MTSLILAASIFLAAALANSWSRLMNLPNTISWLVLSLSLGLIVIYLIFVLTDIKLDSKITMWAGLISILLLAFAPFALEKAAVNYRLNFDENDDNSYQDLNWSTNLGGIYLILTGISFGIFAYLVKKKENNVNSTTINHIYLICVLIIILGIFFIILFNLIGVFGNAT